MVSDGEAPKVAIRTRASRKPKEAREEVGAITLPPFEAIQPAAFPEAPMALPEVEVPSPPQSKKAKRDPFKEDFRKYLHAFWMWRLKEAPTPLHYDIANYLQHGPDKSIIMGFRGMAKSWITVAYVTWLLYCNNQARILVVSGNADKAKEFTTFALSALKEFPLIQHLYPEPGQRSSAMSFDVKGAKPDQAPSVKARGITGQITGSRADVIVPDDVETLHNAMTVQAREDLKTKVAELGGAVLKPGGKVKFLGTPQTQNSIYNDLRKKGYDCRIWPAEVPSDEQEEFYGIALSPYVRDLKYGKGWGVGKPTNPERFSELDLMSRRLEYGLSGYALQFMMDTRLSDAEKYPLKLRDLIVMTLDAKRGPESLAYGADPRSRIPDLQVMGFDGDCYYGPIFTSQEYQPWSGVKAFLDPSGRGGDETGYAVVAELHGNLYVLDAGGFQKGYEPETLRTIARTLVRWNVGKCDIEDNFGDGMFTALLQPYVTKEWDAYNAILLRNNPKATTGGTTLEGVRRSVTQKEVRIIGMLEPIMNQHRLVVDRRVIERDYEDAQLRQGTRSSGLSLFHQVAHITKERGSLPNDDRIDALAGAVDMWSDIVSVDPEEMAKRQNQERMEEYIEDWLEGKFRPGKAMGVMSPGKGDGASRWGSGGATRR